MEGWICLRAQVDVREASRTMTASMGRWVFEPREPDPEEDAAQQRASIRGPATAQQLGQWAALRA
jgi:hypothetical protein